MSIEIPKRLISALEFRRAVPFVGSGISKKSSPSKFPNWIQLLGSLSATAFSGRHLTTQQHRQVETLISDGKLLMAAELIRHALPDDLYVSEMRSKFTYTDADKINLGTQSLIFDLLPKVVVTTNYDRLLEDAYSKKRGRAPSVSSYNDTSNLLATLQDASLSSSPVIFKIHGDVANLNSIILSDRDYRKVMFDEPMYDNVMTSLFMNNVIVFMGFSMSDREVMTHVERLRYRMNYESAPHYALLSRGSTNAMEKAALRRDFGIEVLEYTNSKSHAALDKILKQMATIASGAAK